MALENPPLLIVSDMDRIQVHTNWTNTVQEVHDIALDELADAAKRDLLKAAFTDPDRLRPAKTRQGLTEEAAGRFAALAMNLRRRGHEAHEVAHFVNRVIFCLFAEDVNLLPDRMFQRMIEHAQRQSQMFQTHAATLFAAMQSGGMIGFEQVEWFNGGLFDHAEALPLEAEDVNELLAASRLDWSEIDPSIMGTLFERGLDPDKRSQLGAHYTDRDKIMQIVEPVIIRPLLAEWQTAQAQIRAALDKAAAARSPAARTRAHKEAEGIKEAFLERLANFRVLDPACGSGNFLYLALLSLKDLEHRVNLDAEALGLPRGFPRVGPECVFGIELNPYAAELARVSVWIGEIQWMRRNGFEAARNPILRPLATIENRDAVLGPDGAADWPTADVVVGNPPFLGGKRLRANLGDNEVERLFAAYAGKVRPEADLVLYWVAKAGALIREGRLSRAGLVATNSIRGGANRATLEKAIVGGRIFNAWEDEPWVLDGAAVRVSMICFDGGGEGPIHHNGEEVEAIHSDLTPHRKGIAAVDLTAATQLSENAGVAFMGDTKGGAFDVPGELARKWLSRPLNPNGKPNAEVLRPWINGMDVTRRSSGKWIIDFGWTMTEADAALYEAPFSFAEAHVKAERVARQDRGYAARWWVHERPRQDFWAASAGLARIIITPRVAKHRLFVWLDVRTIPDSAIIAVARDDDTTFGILHSRFHELWSLRMGTSLEDRPRYTSSTTFETFPFPEGLAPDIPAANYASDPRAQAIAAAATRLNELRGNWLNPPDLVRRVPEVVPGYPDRILPVDDKAERELKKRTLTNLYNVRPAWLDHAHKDLDAAVAEAYGWGNDWREGKLTDDEILARLFALNQTRAASHKPDKT
ncbi:class I SAM-dependent DNA methyltransferase [Paracoccus sp. MC1862]|uniref:class I SAM-dependent DNA methyltransferase n=1 Tax=Paracoccus sp. MC1862 TaxID=2760307 RepID=UPI001F392697|nr:class I SAM-dependent DNA methyltransferase [Paracoccus sp. MC1862]